MRRDRVIMLFVCAISIAAVASAQDNPRVGIAMGYPAAVALVWHATPSVGIRPEFSISSTSSTTTVGLSNTSNSNSNLQTNFNVAALFYGASRDNLRMFVSPAFTFQRSSSSSSAVVNAAPNPTYTYGVRGSLGAEYAISARFSAFGEVGAVYGHARVQNPNSSSSSNSWSLRSGAGVILYF